MPRTNLIPINIKPGLDRGGPLPGVTDEARRLLDTNVNPSARRPDAGTLNATSRAMTAEEMAEGTGRSYGGVI